MITFLVIVYIIYRLCEEQSWKTNAYYGKKYDSEKAWRDSLKIATGEMTRSEWKRNYKSGKYVK